MKKYWKYSAILAAAVALTPLAACDDDDTVDPYDINYCYLYQPLETDARLEYKANGQFIIDIDDPLELMPVRTTKPAPQDLTVEVGIDPSLVEVYNKKNGTDYVLLEGATIINPALTIAQGEYVSADPITVTFDHSAFQSGETNYILPVAIKSAGGLTISKSSCIYLTFTSNYRANIITTSGGLNIATNTNEDGWETANSNVTITDFIKATWPADAEIIVKAEIDQSLVEKYNSDNNAEYKTIDASTTSSELHIAAGESSSDLNLTIGDYTGIANDDEYMIPIRLTLISGEGAQLTEGSEVIYITVTQQIEVSASTSPGSLTQITPDKDKWSGISHTVNYGDEDFSSILINNEEYYGIETGDQLVVDLGETVSSVKGFGFEFYAWYYGLSDISDIEISKDSKIWRLAGDASMTGYNSIYYLTFNKPVNFRYLRFTAGDYSYSSYYGCFVRQISFYN